VINHFTTRTALRSWLSRLLGLGFMVISSPLARASMLAASPDCGVTGGGWACYLPGIHRFLVVIAIVLGLLLVAVIGVAVKSYFKIKHDEKVGS
jgi:hypothetical protein